MEGRRWTRFSLRAAMGTVMLLCVVLASWNVRQQRAVLDVKAASGGWTPEVVAPYLLRVERSDNVDIEVTYHVWCFGLTCDLPYAQQSPATGGFFSVSRPRIIVQVEEHELFVPPSESGLLAETEKLADDEATNVLPNSFHD